MGLNLDSLISLIPNNFHWFDWLQELALKFLDAVDALGLPKFPSYGATGTVKGSGTRFGGPILTKWKLPPKRSCGS